MSSAVDKSGNPESAIAPTLAALIPELISAVILYICRVLDAPEFGNVAAPVAAIIIGAPIFKRSQKRDLRRGEVSRTTVAVTIVLGAAAFWLIDVIAGFFALGVLAATRDLFSQPFDAYYLTEEIISLPLKAVGIFLVAVWIGHRLSKLGMNLFNKAVGLYVLANILGNAVIWTHLGSRPFSASDILLPFLDGAVAWVACWVACRYADWTRDRFDSSPRAI